MDAAGSPVTAGRKDGMVKLAVTTRSHLRGVRFFPSMLRASLRIRKQLAGTPGCVRFASIFMSPREVWTITVWRSRQEMIDFMRSGAHEEIMWEFGRWLDSFWLMRWRPSDEEQGTWNGMRLARAPEAPERVPDRSEQQRQALQSVFEAVPRLRAAAGPSGAPSFDNSPMQRRARRLVAGGMGATVRLEVRRWRDVPAAWRRLVMLRRAVLTDDDGLRCAFGVSRPRELYLLAVLRSDDAWRRLLHYPQMDAVRRRWPDGTWTMRWEAENEFGHWDGLRLRRVKLGTKVKVPESAMRAAAGPPERGAARMPTRKR